MRYCQRCCYPENAQPSIIFDEQGVCSGCRVVESRPSIDWAERERWLVESLMLRLSISDQEPTAA